MLPKADSIFSTSRGTTDSGRVTPTFAGKEKIKEKESPTEEAAVVELSTAATKTPSSPTQSAVDDASKFIATAQAAASAIEATLAQAQRNIESIEKTTNPREKEALAEEAETLIAEIETITAAAKFNDQSVVNAGDTTFIVETDPASSTTNTTQGVVISNIALSATNLGLSNTTSSTILSNTAASLTQIEDARSATQSVAVELDAASQEISSLTNEIDQQITSSTETALELDQFARIANQEVRNEISQRASPLLSEKVAAEVNTTKTLLNLQA